MMLTAGPLSTATSPGILVIWDGGVQELFKPVCWFSLGRPSARWTDSVVQVRKARRALRPAGSRRQPR